VEETDTPSRLRFKKSHKQSRRSWIVPDDFPSEQVISAYEIPRVDKFDHLDIGAPDVKGLEIFCRDRLGWTPEQISQSVLAPLAAYTTTGPTQSSMDQFIVGYGEHSRFAAVKSKRMARAIQGLIEEKHGRDSPLEDEVLAVDKDGTPLALSEAVVKWSPNKKAKTKHEQPPTSAPAGSAKSTSSTPVRLPKPKVKAKATTKRPLRRAAGESSSSDSEDTINENGNDDGEFQIRRARRVAGQAASKKNRLGLLVEDEVDVEDDDDDNYDAAKQANEDQVIVLDDEDDDV